jgi:hypothetical protein
MSIKVNVLEKIVTYEVNDLSFYTCYGIPLVITTEFIFKASADGTFINTIRATEKQRYDECIAECHTRGTEITFEEFEKAVATVIENAQSKLAFIKEAMALEGLGALAE